jgi:hypothetical protein
MNNEVEFSFPDIAPIDRVALVNVLTTLKTNKWFSEKRCMRLIANSFAASSFDVDSEKQEIQSESKEEIDRELEENRYRSLAETKLQVWQSYFAQTGAGEEKKQLGYSPSGASQDPAAGGSGKPAQAAGSGRTNSGGMSEQDRASVSKGGR